MARPTVPVLPEPLIIGEGEVLSTASSRVPSPSLHNSLRHGSYFTQWRPRDVPYENHRYNGVMRIETHGQGLTASGDLYFHRGFQWSGGSPPRMIANPDPSPTAGIPIFPRQNYRYYLSVTNVLEWLTTGSSFSLEFQRYSFNHDNNSWKREGKYIAQMKFMAAPAIYPCGATYLEGPTKDASGNIVGTLTMGWVSKYLRKAILEVDRVPVSEYPADNSLGLNWKDVYNAVDWDVDVHESSTDIEEESGASWSFAELHNTMLKRRFSGDVDLYWRYYLLCVREIDGNYMGYMFDYMAADSNNVPREGAAIVSEYKFANDVEKYGTMAGKRLADTPAYFRTAVHEIGHAMGLLHYTRDNGIMNTTKNISRKRGKFLDNVQWSFSAEDERRLRHMPDPWVRPGMMPWGEFMTISPPDRIDFSEFLRLDIKPLLSNVPIGAPVRVRLTIHNTTDAALEVPASLSLKSGNVSGRVIGPGGSNRGFRSLVCCVEKKPRQTLEPDAELSHDLTLLRGGDGALFEAPGLHQIKVDVTWEADDDVNTSFCVCGSASVMVQPAMTDSHAEAALKTLSTPDLLLTLAIGGDHLEDGVEALQAALADETLKPHYAVIEAKRVGRRFGTRNADPTAAAKLLQSGTVMSPSEVKSVASLMGGVVKRGSSAMEVLRNSAAGDKLAEEMVNKL